MKSAFNWWLKVLTVSFRRAIVFSRNKALTGASIAVLGLVLQRLILGKPWHEVGYSLLIILASFGAVLLGVTIWNVITVPAQQNAELEKQHSLALANKDKALTEKQGEIERWRKELGELRSRISQVPIRFQAEKDSTGSQHMMVVDVPQFGGGSQRVIMTIAPCIVLAVWKTPQSRDLEVTLTTCRFQNLQGVTLQPDFSVRRTMKGNEDAVDVTEKLIRPIGGHPVNMNRYLSFEQDIHAVLGYEAQSSIGEVDTSFRLRGKIDGGKLRPEIENLPNPPSSTGGQ